MKRAMLCVWKLEVLVLLLSSLACWGCRRTDGQSQTPTAASSADLSSYAQMEDGSIVVDGHQINWAIGDWEAFPYATWMYLEVNEQDAVGKQPGDNQIAVTLNDLVLSFSDLPAEVTAIVIGVKAVHDDADQIVTECGRFTVVDGSVSIPLEYADLIAYFGVTHYSIWFQALGGNNGQGQVCGQITLDGVMPGGQTVTFTKTICFGTTPAPTSTSASDPTTPTPQPYLDVVVMTGSSGGTSDIYDFMIDEPLGGTAEMYDDGSGTLWYTNGASVVVDTSWSSGSDPFHMSVPAGSPQTGQYLVVVSHDWTYGGSSCPIEALPVTITVQTHTTTQTVTCTARCTTGPTSANLTVTFPAGTILVTQCPLP